MIEPTDEMEQAYEKAWQAVASAESVIGCAEHDMGDCPYHEVPGARRRAGLAAVLAIVERDYRIEPRPSWEMVHLIGDGFDSWVTRCCGRAVEDLPNGERFTHLASHRTCTGPS